MAARQPWEKMQVAWITSETITSTNFFCVVEQARNLVKQQNIALSIGHYLNNMAKLTNQWNEHNYKDLDRQRIYLKDIDCPEVWHEKLKERIPPCVFYMNESTGEFGGPGSIYESFATGPGTRKGLGVARAGDLMSCLPPAMRADNLMCYIGHEGTYTPAHREMCASLGQNIMVETSGTLDEDGKPTKPGSSIWFMTETKDRHLVSEYWLSTLGHDIEIEAHFAQINAWKAAPFKTYVVEQKVGDFILIPPLAPHQVWNRGTRTMKVAWNRTTVETLEMALNEALPRARMVCRDEQYKNKAMVMFALEKYSSLLKQVDAQKQAAIDEQTQLDLNYSPKIRQLQKDFKRLFALYTKILLSETLAPVSPGEKKGQYLPYDGYVTCSYCRCNIFNRFLTCTSCIIPLENGEEDTYDICMECYAMGRSCKCLSKYKWVEQFPWQDLVRKHDIWRNQIIAFEGKLTDKSPKPLEFERKNMTKKTLAQVCQEQLKARPWVDPSKPIIPSPVVEEKDSDDGRVNEDGTIQKKRRKRLSGKVVRDTVPCHISQKREPRWKMAVCQCGRGYAYGSLFRAFDLMPLSVMEDPNWKCPYCLKICSCAACRKLPDMRPFEPKGTILGHDTRKVADVRSVESLVDFSHSNMVWIKKAGDTDPHENKRLRRCRDEAAQDKSIDPDLDDHYVNVDECTPVATQPSDNGIRYNMDIDYPIDPLLTTDSALTAHGNSNGPSTENPQLVDDTYRAAKRPRLAVGPDLSKNAHPLAGSGLGSSNTGNNEIRQPRAPMAIMGKDDPPVGTSLAQANNGIIYQYPDPNATDFETSPQKEHHHSRADVPAMGEPKNPLPRVQLDARTVVPHDAFPSARNDANAQYHRARIERTLAEAKRNDRFISAEAAITGKSLHVKFSVDKARLAELGGLNNAAPAAASSPGMAGVEAENADTTIVQSDLPAEPSPPSQAGRPGGGPKKKKARTEADDDFSTRKKGGRKAATARASLPNPLRRSSMNDNDEESSSGSDGNVSARDGPPPPDKSRKPRTLPAYLARRSDGVLLDASLDPYAALTKHRQRRKIDRARHEASEAPPQVSEVAPNHQPRSGAPVKATAKAANGVSKRDASNPVVTADLTVRGPRKTTTAKDAAVQRAEENRKAKLRALRWAEDDEYESI